MRSKYNYGRFNGIDNISDMNIYEIRETCLAKPGVIAGFSFKESILVFKMMIKMVALLDLSKGNRWITLKSDQDLAIDARDFWIESI